MKFQRWLKGEFWLLIISHDKTRCFILFIPQSISLNRNGAEGGQHIMYEQFFIKITDAVAIISDSFQIFTIGRAY